MNSVSAEYAIARQKDYKMDSELLTALSEIDAMLAAVRAHLAAGSTQAARTALARAGELMAALTDKLG